MIRTEHIERSTDARMSWEWSSITAMMENRASIEYKPNDHQQTREKTPLTRREQRCGRVGVWDLVEFLDEGISDVRYLEKSMQVSIWRASLSLYASTLSDLPSTYPVSPWADRPLTPCLLHVFHWCHQIHFGKPPRPTRPHPGIQCAPYIHSSSMTFPLG